jgi:hypothetical protein
MAVVIGVIAGPAYSKALVVPTEPVPPNPATHVNLPPEIASPPAQPLYQPGEGLTVSMLNGSSTLKLSAAFSLLGISATERPFVPWNPLFLLPRSPFGLNTNSFEMHGRQSSLQAAFSGPEVAGFTPGALAKLYLISGSLTSDSYGILPVVAFADLKNDRWRLSAGLQPDLFAPRDPNVIPVSLLGGSGNPGTFRGQLRVEHFINPSESFQTTLQVALGDPTTTVLIDNSRRSTEGNGWPNVEARVLFGVGENAERIGGRKERTAELGVGGVIGQIRNSRLVFDLDELNDPSPPRRTAQVWGVSVDGKLNLTERFGVAGEFYTGQALGSYAANIFQTFNPVTYAPVRGSGGWGEVFVYLNDQLHLHTGYGVEVPVRADLGPTGIARNETFFTTLFWNATQAIQVSFEVDYRRTDFVGLADNNGLVFMSQLLWRF